MPFAARGQARTFRDRGVIVSKATPVKRCGAWIVACMLLGNMTAAANEAEDQFAVAAGHYARGRFEFAWQEFDQFLTAFADHPRAGEARFFRAESGMQARRYKTAREDYRGYLQQQPAGAHAQQARFRVAEASYLLGDHDQAAGDLRQFLAAHPDDSLGAYAWPYLAEMQLAAGNVAAAVTSYQQALQKFPTGPLEDDCRFGLARAHESRQHWDEAQLYYRAVAAKSASPLAAKAQYHLGQGEFRRGQWDTAQSHWEQVVRRFPQDPWADRAQLAIARCSYRQSHWQQAEERLRPLLKHAQLGAEAALWLGLTQKAQSHWAAAQATLTQAMPAAAAGNAANSLLHAALVFHAADAARMAGDLTVAARLYDQVVRDWPSSPLVADGRLGQMLTAAAAQDHAAVDRLGQQIATQAPVGRQRIQADRAWVRSLLARRQYADAIVLLIPLVNHSAPLRRSLDMVHAAPPNVPQAPAETAAGDPSAPLSAGDSTPPWSELQLVTHTAALQPSDTRQRIEDLYLLALAYQGLGRHDESLILAEQAMTVADEPLLADVRLTCATSLLAMYRDLEAVPHLEHYRQRPPSGERRAYCLEELSLTFARLGLIDRARAVYDELNQEATAERMAVAVGRLGQTLQARGELEFSGELYQYLLTLNPPDELGGSARAGLARSLTARNEHAQAAEVWQSLLQQHPRHAAAGEAALARARYLADQGQLAEAMPLYQGVIAGTYTANSEQQAVALWGAGQTAERQGNRAAALQRYAQLDRNFADLTFRDALLYQWAWLLRDGQPASPAEQAAQTEQVEQLFERIVNQHPGSSYWHDALFRWAESLFERGEYAASAAQAQRLLVSNPPVAIAPHVMFLVARQGIAAKDWPAARQALQQLVTQYPRSSLAPLAGYWLAESMYQQNQWEPAQQQFAQLPAEFHSAHPHLAAMSQLRQAQCLAALKKWKQAQELVEAATAQFPNFQLAYEFDYLRGRCLAAKALFAEARVAYLAVTRSSAGNKTETAAMAQWMIGETYFHQQEFETAIREYLKVEILYAHPLWQSASLLQAGKCHERLGQYGQAAELFARLAKDYPDSPHAADALERMPLAKQRAASTN